MTEFKAYLRLLRLAIHYVNTIRIAWLNVVLVETGFDATPHLAADDVLLPRAGLDQHQVVDFVATYLFDSGNLGRGDDLVGKIRIGCDFRANLGQHFHHQVAVRVVRHGNMQRKLRPVARQVADHGDLAIGNVVDRAIRVAQHGTPQSHRLHRPLNAGDSDHVADVVLIFHQQEEAVYEVFDQGLRAKADSDAGNSCAGQQR